MSAEDRWWNPIVVAIIGATAVLGGNIYATWRQTDSAERQLHQKAQSDLVLEAIKTNDPQLAAKNLLFLVNLSLLDDPGGHLRDLLSKPENAPYLPKAGTGFGQGGFGQGGYGGSGPGDHPGS